MSVSRIATVYNLPRIGEVYCSVWSSSPTPSSSSLCSSAVSIPCSLSLRTGEPSSGDSLVASARLCSTLCSEETRVYVVKWAVASVFGATCSPQLQRQHLFQNSKLFNTSLKNIGVDAITVVEIVFPSIRGHRKITILILTRKLEYFIWKLRDSEEPDTRGTQR